MNKSKNAGFVFVVQISENVHGIDKFQGGGTYCSDVFCLAYFNFKVNGFAFKQYGGVNNKVLCSCFWGKKT